MEYNTQLKKEHDFDIVYKDPSPVSIGYLKFSLVAFEQTSGLFLLKTGFPPH
jgi:hypothetical protein